MNPVVAGLEDDHLAPASRLAQLGGFRAGRNSHGLFVHERSTVGLPSGERSEQEDSCDCSGGGCYCCDRYGSLFHDFLSACVVNRIIE